MRKKCANTKYNTSQLENTPRTKPINMNIRDTDVESQQNEPEYISNMEFISEECSAFESDEDMNSETNDFESETHINGKVGVTRYDNFAYHPIVVHPIVNTSNANVQTEEIEKDIAVQANIIPKVSYPLKYRNQLVQTASRLTPDYKESSLKSFITDQSEFCDSKQVPFPHVVHLPAIPVKMKEHGNYVGQLEERAYRISRWLDDRTGENDSSETFDVKDSNNKVSPNMSLLQSNSIIESFIARLKENVRVLPIHKESTAIKAEDDKKLPPDGVHNQKVEKEITKESIKDKKAELNDVRRSPIRNGNDELLNGNEVNLKKLKQVYSPPKTPESPNRPEPIKVKRKFSNYLKGQYRTIEDETIGKSFMMMQDLKQVLQQREESRTKGMMNK